MGLYGCYQLYHTISALMPVVDSMNQVEQTKSEFSTLYFKASCSLALIPELEEMGSEHCWTRYNE